jgi:hypothetical protein
VVFKTIWYGYCSILIYVSHLVTLVIVYIMTEGNFHAVCKRHFHDLQNYRPAFSSISNHALIDEEAPRKVAQCSKLMWQLNMDHCQWLVACIIGDHIFLFTEEYMNLTWPQVIFGVEKQIKSLLGKHMVRIVDIFDKSHGLSLVNHSAHRDIRGSYHDAVEDLNNHN